MSEANGKRRLEPDDLPTTSSSSSHAHACKACSRSKRRCDRKQPCSHCAAKGQPCEQFCDDEGAVKKPRKKRFPEATLLATIKAYEAALTANGIDAEAVKRAASVDESAESTTLDASHPDALEEFDNVQSIVQGESAPNGIQGGKTLAPASSCSLFSLPRDLPNRQAILRHFDEAFEDDAHSLLAFKDHAPGQPLNHPSTFQIFKLWSTYTERVHPVCKILHAPTMQERIFAIGDSLEAKATPTDHALLFAIYFIAAFTLSGAELGAVFGSETDVQTTLLHLAMSTQTALARAGVFKSSNLGVLQAYILYLIPLQREWRARGANALPSQLNLHRAESTDPTPLSHAQASSTHVPLPPLPPLPTAQLAESTYIANCAKPRAHWSKRCAVECGGKFSCLTREQ